MGELEAIESLLGFPRVQKEQCSSVCVIYISYPLIMPSVKKRGNYRVPQ